MTPAGVMTSIAILTLSLLACGVEQRIAAQQTRSSREVELDEKNRQLQKELEEEREKNRAQTQYISDATKTVNDIQDELNKISSEEAVLTARARSIELQANVDRSQRDELFDRVGTLTQKLRDAEKRLGDYKQQIKDQNAQIGELAQTIENLKTSMALRDTTIKQLRQTIESMKIKVEVLEAKVSAQTAELNQGRANAAEQGQKIDKLSEGVYILDSLRNLEHNGIIRYEGGLLRMGRVPRVNGGIDRARNRHLIDIRDALTLSIPYPCDQVRVVSEQDVTSWKKEPGAPPLSCQFSVTNSAVFWRSKTLVIGVAR
jgi:peptidoglycan hydrolase CwlO-like protein